MAGRLSGGDRKTRDAVAAKLAAAQKRKEEKHPNGFGEDRRAAQNKRVSDRILGKNKDK